jgi:hypothetical protein
MLTHGGSGYPVFMTPLEQEYGEDGVDLTLIRWMLSLTPGERLDVAQWHSNLMLDAPGLHCGAD